MTSLQQSVDAYSATLAPDVPISETARAGLNLLRDTARLVLAPANITGTTERQRLFAATILASIDAKQDAAE
ncbi:MAG: hypothetical protein WBA42_01810 [Mesorhizobium sp.]